jgi:8-oxo-dGTP pyrophosphatase MutT (NUDIX family)
MGIEKRKCTRSVVFDDTGGETVFLLLLRKKADGSVYWQNPQGGIDFFEKEAAGALREVWEETGLEDLELLAHTRYETRYLAERDGKPTEVSLAAYAVRGNEGERVNLGMEEEHIASLWCGYEDALSLLTRYPEQREVFTGVCALAGLGPAAPAGRKQRNAY